MRIILFLSLLYPFNTQASNDTIIDANFSRIEVFSGKIIPNKVVKSQTIITVFYYGFDNKIHQGQVVCHYLFADCAYADACGEGRAECGCVGRDQGRLWSRTATRNTLQVREAPCPSS